MWWKLFTKHCVIPLTLLTEKQSDLSCSWSLDVKVLYHELRGLNTAATVHTIVVSIRVAVLHCADK